MALTLSPGEMGCCAWCRRRCCCCCCCCCCREEQPGLVSPAAPFVIPVTQQPVASTGPQGAYAEGYTTSPILVLPTSPPRSRPPLPAVRFELPEPPPPLPTAPPAVEDTEYQWTKHTLLGTEPAVMVSPGFFVGRVEFEKLMLPAILEAKRMRDMYSGTVVDIFYAAHFFYKDRAGSTEDFEVLSCKKTSWESAMGGFVVPNNAILCGRTANGTPLYFGRVFEDGEFHFGTADPEAGLLYSMARGPTWYGCVRTSQNFDILIAA